MKRFLWFGLAVFGSLMMSMEVQAQTVPVNYDEAKVPQFTLPDPLVCEDGTVVKTAEQWEKVRRPEILKLFQEQMFGKLPEVLSEAGNHPEFVTFEVVDNCDSALDGRAIRKQVVITFADPNSDKKVTANLLIYIPKNAKGPVPVFLGCNFLGNHTIAPEKEILLYHLRDASTPATDENLPADSTRGVRVNRWDLDQILEAGYALATVHYIDIVDDNASKALKSGIFTLYSDYQEGDSREGTDWGAITAWAWGLSRALDYIETDSLMDAKKVAVMGHSRLGKTSLWAGASDTRFALVISNDSGCGGAALSRREFGETLRIINRAFPHWFCRNFREYNERVNDLPIDEHELVALMAPRPVYVASASEDNWADQKGEYLSALYAVPVYKLYFEAPFGDRVEPELPAVDTSVGNVIGYHNRTGKHDVTSFDWAQYIRFADKFLK